MPVRINISESDLTRSVQPLSDNDIVFIPGLSALDASVSTAAAPLTPTLCSSVQEFHSYFGQFPATFAEDVIYPASPGSTIESFPITTHVQGAPITVTVSNTISSITSIEAHTQSSGTEPPEAAIPLTTFTTEGKEITIDTTDVAESLEGYTIDVSYLTVDIGGFNTAAIDGWTTSSPNVTWFEQGDPDPSWIYAALLLSYGLRVMYCRVNSFESVSDGTYVGEPGSSATAIVDFYDGLEELYSATSPLYSKGDFNFKFLTTGGYPVYEYKQNTITTLMINLASTRGDAFAMIDHTDNPSRPLMGDGSVFKSLNDSSINSSYAAMFTPWASYIQTVAPTSTGVIFMPASFGYFSALASSLISNPNWLVVSGVTRGKIPNIEALHTNAVLTNAIADAYQDYQSSESYPLQINPITYIRPYGLCIWGNRSLRNNSGGLQALSYLNIRSLVCDIKKQIYSACTRLLFEQNTTVLWTNFKSYITPLLDRMMSGSGISNYTIIRNSSSIPTKISASIRIYPIYSVESFDISVELTDDDITVS